MNRKSELHKMLEYKPIINPNTKDIFFDPYEKKDVKIMKKYSINHFWTWLIPDGKDVISSGYWNFDRNAYVITEIPLSKDKEYPNGISFRLLPRDFAYLNEMKESA